jgi:hypothetical protein
LPNSGGLEKVVENTNWQANPNQENVTIALPSGEVLQRKIVINKHGQWNQIEMEASNQASVVVLSFDTSATTVRMAPPAVIPVAQA